MLPHNGKRQHIRRLPNGALEQLGGVRSAFKGVRGRRGGGESVAGADLVGPAAGENAFAAGPGAEVVVFGVVDGGRGAYADGLLGLVPEEDEAPFEAVEEAGGVYVGEGAGAGPEGGV